MHKIFKYKVKEIDGKFYTAMPEDAIIIRMGDVHDDFYNGHFIWAIVNTEDINLARLVDYKEWSANPKPELFSHLDKKQLSVKEKQSISLPYIPRYAQDVDGKLYVYYNKFEIHPFESYKIVFYKTGQEITEPIDNLKYLGLCRLWIMQEPGLYTFLVNE